MADPASGPGHTPDFEKSLSELESLVDKMEHGELSLEESLAHYERGVQLTRDCQAALDQAQLRLDLLSESDLADHAAEHAPDSPPGQASDDGADPDGDD